MCAKSTNPLTPRPGPTSSTHVPERLGGGKADAAYGGAQKESVEEPPHSARACPDPVWGCGEGGCGEGGCGEGGCGEGGCGEGGCGEVESMSCCLRNSRRSAISESSRRSLTSLAWITSTSRSTPYAVAWHTG